MSDEIKPTLPMLEKRPFKDKECNDHHCHEGKRWEILKEEVGIIPVIQSNTIIFKIEY